MQDTYDVLIAGSGVAGLHAALSLDRSLSVLILAKNDPDLCNTALAQGGVAAVLDREHDNEELHFTDTLIAGGRTNDPQAVKVLVEEGPANVLGLEAFGVEFDRNADGSLNLTLEGGHSRRRIAHHNDLTGLEIEKRLLAAVRERANITLAAHTELMKTEQIENGFAAGVYTEGELKTLRCRFLIFATGGVGRAYQYTTNSAIATGDGIALAERLGARITGLSLVQFHPTAFAGVPGQQRFLISESVRGEGAKLLNCHGERFMPRYDAREELAPRDVVSQAIRSESRKTGSEAFYLDITGENPDFVRRRFPAIFEKCLTYGIDMTRDRIPVYPCQHYLMGGIDVDTYARTTLPGLYALGECSHTGVHGNNRLASNSLLEALVFSKRAADDIMGKISGGPLPGTYPAFMLRGGREVPSALAGEIQSLLQKSYFILPDRPSAETALPRICEIEENLKNSGYAQSSALFETESLAAVARMTLTEVLQK